MEAKLPEEHLQRLSAYVAETLGLHFPPSRWPDLQRGIAAAAKSLGFENTAACAQWLMSAPVTTKNQLEALAGSLTIGETYFFREKRSFEVLAEHILPDLIRARRGGEQRLRIWSAACCTGEEAYSIAILVRRTIPEWKDWNVTILATDVNDGFLRKAEAGVYGHWSFRDVPEWLTQSYFRATSNGRFEVLPEIKAMVQFAHLNLVEDVYPSVINDTNAMDVIFCRNVLMYFTAAQAKKVIEKLYRAQVDGGWLIVSPSELLHVSSSPYVTKSFHGAIVYQKGGVKGPGADWHRRSGEALPRAMDLPQEQSFATPAPSRSTVAPESSQDAQPPDDVYAQALALYEQGIYAESADKLEQSRSIRPLNPAATRLLAHALANQGKLTGALARCDEWIAADKLNPSAHYLRAIVLQEQGAADEAVRSLRRVLYLDSKFALAHFGLGNIARCRGHHGEADKHLENALRLLGDYRPDEILPESDGVTAGRFTEIVKSLMDVEAVR